MTDSFSQIAYMPYAPIKQNFQIGNYNIWPYYEECYKRISNNHVIEHLDKFFKRYQERKYDLKHGGYDKPIESIYIISPENFKIGFEKFTQQQIHEIKSISHILAFCAINDYCFVADIANPFVLHIQKFQVGQDRIALWNTIFQKMDMVKFIKPYYINGSILQFEKTDLTEALGKAMKIKNDDRINRIFRALENFYYASSCGELITDGQKLLLLLMSFEILLNFSNKFDFVKKLEEILVDYKPQNETRTIKINNKNVDKTFSRIGWWAFDLYILRNSIVHGNKIDWEIQKYGDVYTRISFGGCLLRKIVKKILNEKKFLISDLVDKISESINLDEKLEEVVNQFNKLMVD